jgi:hypothetical protein
MPDDLAGGMMRVFHRTDAADNILRDGFRDGEGTYGTMNWYRGVWFSDTLLDENEGAFGDTVFAVEMPEEVFEDYEWVEGEKTYRESLIPAEVVNRYPRRIIDDDELDELWRQQWA